ncbi:MAG TPA: hypothetical protein VJP45_10925 [Candidatus Limnocylindria bacterium]|nr:hypothetical protein [Candidatus Limnocylindria bacterium]
MDAGPALRIEPVGVAEREGDGWRTTWRLSNLAQTPVHIRGATAPHSQFRGQAALALDVPADGSATFSLSVAVDGVTGSEIENAFLIVLADIGDSPWRVLARLRVSLEDRGRPSPRVETITVQRVGFSGEL